MDCWVLVFDAEPSPSKIDGLVSYTQIIRKLRRVNATRARSLP